MAPEHALPLDSPPGLLQALQASWLSSSELTYLEKDRRLLKHADTWRSPSQENVPWVQSDKPREAEGQVRLWAESGLSSQVSQRVGLAVTGSIHLLGDPGYQIFGLEHHLVGVAALDNLPIHSTGDL